MKRLPWIICCVSVMLGLKVSYGQESYQYVINSGDVLSIHFWQAPEMNAVKTVTKEGTISLSVGGPINAAGLTMQELSDAIVERISIFNRRITHAAVTVVEYGSQKIYVMGSVTRPGKYTFEVIPNLWDIISEAGGPSANADLTNVIISRVKDEEEMIENVDLADILKRGNLTSLPKIKAGDNIYVPAISENAGRGGIGVIQTQENVLFIYGSVGAPGIYNFNKELNLLEALVAAGGPNIEAKLNQVHVIRKEGAYSDVIVVDVERYSQESVPDFFMVQGGDAIYVPRKIPFRDTIWWEMLRVVPYIALTAFTYSILSVD